MTRRLAAASVLTCLALAPARGQDDGRHTAEWTVGGEKRQAVVIPPAKKTDAPPAVLVFHGHGGTMQAMTRLGFQTLWPEAVVVCPQGLPTATARDPKGERAGWQPKAGDNDDRDLKFVDAVLTTLREKYAVDARRVYATGHSNGGGFTYLLGGARGTAFAAIAPSAAGAGGLRAGAAARPLPVLHVAGEKDETVPFENQTRTIAAVRKLNGCEAEGKPWAKAGTLVATVYESKGGTPVVAAVHPGTHKYPAEAPELIVKFFKEHARK